MSAPHLIYLAWGFPPAAKSCTYRMLATANSFVRAGWDVTVITLTEDAWRHEQGLDTSLLELVDPRIEIRRVPFLREDLATDVRYYDQRRAEQPVQWLKELRRDDTELFPEVVYGRWRDDAVAAVRAAHADKPADLFLTSATPYTFFAPALDLWQQSGVPYVLDYRDSWAIDILKDKPGFAPDSPQAVFETELLSHATEAWFVNAEIRDAYAAIYPDDKSSFHVVRNGSDEATGTDQLDIHIPTPEEGLTFGYLGTVTFDVKRMQALCDGWRLAGQRSDVIARSRLEFRGYMGTGSARGHTAQAEIIQRGSDVGISYKGAVPKAETAAVYGSWDVLVLCLVGGRFVTSGKVYDYMSTGLPVLSVHDWEHAAVEVLSGYPLWVRNHGVEADDIADAFIAAAERACSASVSEHESAREFSRRYERYAQLRPAVERLSERLGHTVEWQAAQARASSGTVAVGPEAGATTDLTGEEVVLFHTLPLREKTASAIARLRRAGAAVHLIGPASVTVDPATADSMVALRRATSPLSRDETRDVRKFSSRWVGIVATNAYRSRVLTPVVRKLGLPAMWWMSAARSEAAQERIARATSMAAVDDGAIAMAWNAARVNHTAPTLNGIGPLLEELGLHHGGS